MKNFILGFMTLYLSMAIVFGIGIKQVIPPINTYGQFYYGAIWPIWPISAMVDKDLAPIPQWAFTFKSYDNRNI